MNTIINRENPRASGGFTVKKKNRKNLHPRVQWQWLPSWLLAINQSVAESTLPAKLSDASADNNVYYQAHEPDRASGTTIGLSVFPCGTDFLTEIPGVSRRFRDSWSLCNTHHHFKNFAWKNITCTIYFLSNS